MTQDIVSTIACNIDSMSNQEISDIIDILSSTLRERMDDDVSSCEENEENEEDEYHHTPRGGYSRGRSRYILQRYNRTYHSERYV